MSKFDDFLKENKSTLYQLASQHANYNSKGSVVLPKDDEWREETDWDEFYEQTTVEVKQA